MSTTFPTVQIRPRGAAVWTAIGFNLLPAVLGTGLIVRAVTDHQAAALGAVGAILVVPLLLIGLLATSGELTRTELTIRAGVLRHRTLPLSRVVDSGMIYTLQPRISCWVPYVWLDDGSAVRLPIGGHAGDDPRSSWSADRWAELAATPQGLLCTAVLERALANSGLPGPHSKATEPPTGGRPRELAYWPAARPASRGAGDIALTPDSGVMALPARYRADGDRGPSSGRRWRRRIVLVAPLLLVVGVFVAVWRADSTASLDSIVRADTPGVVAGGWQVTARCTQCMTTEFVITTADVSATQRDLAVRLVAAKLSPTSFEGAPAYYDRDHNAWVSWTATGGTATLPGGAVIVDITQEYR